MCGISPGDYGDDSSSKTQPGRRSPGRPAPARETGRRQPPCLTRPAPIRRFPAPPRSGPGSRPAGPTQIAQFGAGRGGTPNSQPTVQNGR